MTQDDAKTTQTFSVKLRFKPQRFLKSERSLKVIRFASPFVLLIIWEMITRLGSVPDFILPAPSAIFRALFELVFGGVLLPHIGISVFRAVCGFLLGSTLGITVGLLMSWSRLANSILDIPFNLLRTVPEAAIIPVFIVWFGYGELPKVLLVSITSFIYCVINTMTGFKSIDPDLIKAARSLGAKNRDIFKEVTLPSVAPMIFAALRLGIVVSFILLVIVEMLGAQKGLGYYMMMTQRLFYTDKMFAALITVTMLAFTFDILIRRIEAHVLRWRQVH